MAANEPTMEAHVAHGSYSTTPMSVPLDGLGAISLGVCSECHLILAHCLHNMNDWNEEGTHLICRLCGLDGT